MAAAGEDVQSLLEKATCPACLQFFSDPVSVRCGHSFCEKCLPQLYHHLDIIYSGHYSHLRHFVSPGFHVKHWWEWPTVFSFMYRVQFPDRICPICCQHFDNSFRPDQTLANLTAKVGALKLHPTERESELRCQEHEEEVKLFCETDGEFLCTKCQSEGKHKDHPILPIYPTLPMTQEEASRCFRFCKLRKWAFKEMEQKQKEEIPRVKEQSSSLQTHIASEFSKMHQILTEKELCLLRDLREEEERILEPMEKNLGEIQKNLAKIQDQLSFFQKHMEHKDSERFQEEAFVHHLRNWYPDTSGIIKSEGLHKKKFTNPLGDPLWKDLLPAINPESHRAEMVSVTLDVETANPQLEVSDDRRLLKYTGSKRSSLPDTRKRFMDSPCVLGSEGFTSGRHYWEVEVTGNRGWRLGVAAESVERKRGVSLCPENRFWTIGRDWSQLSINSSLRSPLRVSQIPGKVGVYLSYESGTVSFFGADTKSHLHTFTGNKFTEKMYPFFFTSDLKNCLKI
ncbi:nuclear factor 7, ovary-like isoform X2 [Scyliorhinus canicula]|uniref:nuclear factor 7, ovary-like isoform X2 n=1 Tax=Scyliorhinus canicula TaxID=7830 RepID=UPI0018F60B5E|nr:nuclear factor 7, ovary-like isoform X2 [Scyliorhinus canicula]